MTTVVDSSVLVAALVDTGTEGAWAESVVDDGQLTCPELALAEASNILRRLELTGDLSRREATVAHENLLRLDLSLRDWLLTLLLAVGAGLVSLAYRRWLWRPRAAPDRSALALELPFFVVLNPVAEELFFRGAALFGLANLVGMPWAIAITSVVFGVHHVLARFPVSFLVLGTLGGAMFGIMTAQFGSIVPAIVMHAAADLAVFVAAGLMADRVWASDDPHRVERRPVDRLAAPTP